jgi:sorting nexin-8
MYPLQRNHPVIKEDALLSTFLSEPSFEQWRKQSSISLEEESASKRIDRVEEMTIPSDLEDKLGYIADFFFAFLRHSQH